jgi:hypothetical protein
MKYINHDTSTGEIIERNPTKTELEEWQKSVDVVQAEKNAAEELATKKLEVLEILGITPEQAKLLFS